VRRACDARAEGRRREGCISTLPARVAAACNTCNMSDRDDEEEACSGCWRAELREDRVLNDFALRPFRARRPTTFPILPVLSSDPSLFPRCDGGTPQIRRRCIMHGHSIFSYQSTTSIFRITVNREKRMIHRAKIRSSFR